MRQLLRLAVRRRSRSARPTSLPLRPVRPSRLDVVVARQNNQRLGYQARCVDVLLAPCRIEREGARAQPSIAHLAGNATLAKPDQFIQRDTQHRGQLRRSLETGKPYVDIRKQWKRLLDIAGEILGYKLKGKKAKFLNFRHTGASDVAKRGRDASHLLRVVRMMGDTSLATVNRHYFNLDDEAMEEIIEGWEIPDAEVFAPDLPPLCEEPEPDEGEGSSVAA